MTAGRRASRHRELELDAATSKRLAQIRQRDTAPELAVRRLIHRLGVRFRRSAVKLPGAPDVVNRRRKWAIFVHGCFWHRHAGCVRASTPRRNRDFWLRKFAANRRRDERVVLELHEMGFRTMVLWECEIEERPLLVERKLARFLATARHE